MVTRSFALALAASAMAPVCAYAQGNTPAPIEQAQLSELNVWTVGAISRADGALANDIWVRSDPATLVSAFDRLPAVYDSPAMQTLARRVLLTSADAPSGDAMPAARKRFEALGKMGAADELAIMAAGAGSSGADVAIAQYAAQAELARGRRPEACARGRNANVGDTTPTFLLRLRAYCAAVTGDRAAADLALELARAQNASDAWYTGAVAAAGGAPPARPPAARYENSLTTQLSIAGGLRPARTNALANASTLAFVALARAENAPQPQRAQATALAFYRGALSATEARAILAATPADVTTGLPSLVTALRRVTAANAPPAAGSEAPPNPALEKATAITEALRQARTPAEFGAVARFFLAEIKASPVAPDTAGAVLLARAAIATGDTELGRRLVSDARQAGADEIVLAPLDAALAALTGAHVNTDAMVLQRRIDRGARQQARVAARDVTILLALGASTNESVQAFLAATPPQGGAAADAETMQALTSAVQRNAVGEGAALAVVAAGQAGPARLDTASVVAIIQALRGLRLEEDARRIAAEAILAGQPAA